VDRKARAGGVAVAIQNGINNIVTIVDGIKDIAEQLWVRINNGQTDIRVGIVYAAQVSRTKTFLHSIFCFFNRKRFMRCK